MDPKKPDLNSEFSLDQLAEELNIPSARITQALNEVLGTNFYNFVNESRVREFIRLLDSAPEERTSVLHLAFEVGFNSKSASTSPSRGSWERLLPFISPKKGKKMSLSRLVRSTIFVHWVILKCHKIKRPKMS